MARPKSTKEKPTIKLIGHAHFVDFAEERGVWTEDREALFKANKAIRKFVKYGDVVALEIDPVLFSFMPQLVKELKSQPDAARLRFRSLGDLQGKLLQRVLTGLDPKKFDIEKVFERIGHEVFFARLTDSLKKAGAKTVPIDSHELLEGVSELRVGSKRLQEISVERERNFAKDVLKIYRKTGRVPVVMTGSFHAEPLKEILSKHFHVEMEICDFPESEKGRLATVRVNRKMRERRLEKLRRKRFLRRFQGHNRQLALPKPKPK